MQVGGGPADQLGEEGAPHLEVVLERDLLRAGQVQARLRLLLVGDGRGADLEVAARRSELLADRLLLRPHHREAVLGGQHVEVGLRHAQDQVLAGLGELGLGDLHRQLGLAHHLAVGRPVHRHPSWHV